MKIGKTPDGISGKTVNNTASSLGGSNKREKAEVSSSPNPLKRVSGTDRLVLLVRKIDSLVSSLDGRNKVHLSLVPLLNLIKEMPAGSNGLPHKTLDKELMLRVLNLWKSAHGHTLSEKAGRELENLEKLLQDEGESKYMYMQKSAYNRPGLLIKEEKQTLAKVPEGGSIRLDMTLKLKRLGTFQVIIEQKGPFPKCTVLAEENSGFRELKKVRKKLLERIAGRGLSLSSLKIRNKPPSEDVSVNLKHGGVQIWG